MNDFVKIKLMNIKTSFFKHTKFSRWIGILAIVTFLSIVTNIFFLNSLVVSHFSNKTLQVDYIPSSKVVVNMLLLTEDQSFFNHSGVDFKEIARVLRDYWLYDKPIRGASTITQQLIKNELLTRERRIDRKLKEVLMAVLLELSFDKNFILNYYMNSVYLGQKGNLAIHGFAHAAKFYFNNDIDKLTLEEVATLVAMVKGPSYYHPIKYPQRLAKRRQLVLSLYHKYEKIVK
ncbi:Multimodular transpeptidase-transglycosylase [hydrothermal vent metagenome]|uniref:peptidoglycan glycosyltransferase n=1 Tax=hydrothermal vent metagenome TaxID=652676 RepID=A0A1W1D975_9ZZZZ